MKINLKNIYALAWTRGGSLLALGALVAGCGGSGGPRTRPTATPGATAVATAQPTTLPNASEILFVSKREVPNVPSGQKLFSANLDGSNLTYIPTGGDGEPQNPEWVPGKREVVYNEFSRSTFTSNIRRANRDGTGDRAIAGNRTYGATVSPDGSRLAYFTQRSEIFIANPDGTNPRRLAAGFSPSWSPDGKRLVYADDPNVVPSENGGRFPEITLINADGTNQTRLTTSRSAQTAPRFSPDGSRIVYMSAPFNGGGAFEISVMNADGSNQTQITNNNFGEVKPHWTADGRRIMFLVSAGENNSFQGTLTIMDADGSNRTPLTGALSESLTDSFDIR